uniref:Uncharacterized protein n=1 Tax=Arundo donax TaxID=35708 RepID=A0A0A9H666_ARUDO
MIVARMLHHEVLSLGLTDSFLGGFSFSVLSES